MEFDAKTREEWDARLVKIMGRAPTLNDSEITQIWEEKKSPLLAMYKIHWMEEGLHKVR